VVSPEGAAIGSLTVSVLCLGVAVLLAFATNLLHLADSVFDNYLFALYAGVFVSVVLLTKTRKKYRDHWAEEAKTTKPILGSVSGCWWVRGLVAIALTCLFLPWAKGFGLHAPLRGYHFVLSQRPIAQHYSQTTYPIAPNIFLELRCQVAVALLFLVVCGLHSV